MIGTNESNWSVEDTLANHRRRAKIKLAEMKEKEKSMFSKATREGPKTVRVQWTSKP